MSIMGVLVLLSIVAFITAMEEDFPILSHIINRDDMLLFGADPQIAA